MHRSGTSVLTHAIETLGAYLGSKPIDAKKDNEKGFFENTTVLRYNQDILTSLNCSWDSILIPNLTQQQVTENSNLLTELICREYKHINFWGIKDPRIIRLNIIWQETFQNLNITPYYLLANRNPQEVANSLYLRNKINICVSLLLWLQHQIDSLELIIEHGGIVIDYNKMLSKPRHEIDRLAKFLEIDTHLHEEKIEHFTQDFLSKDLHHNKNNTEACFFPDLNSLCDKVYNHLSQLSASPDSLLANKEKVQHSKNIISEVRNYLKQNEGLILEFHNITSTHTQNINKVTVEYENKILALTKEKNILQSRINWITNRPIYILFKKAKKCYTFLCKK